MKKTLLNTLILLSTTFLFTFTSSASGLLSETFEIGKYTNSANGTGVTWVSKKDGSNFPGCNQPLVWIPNEFLPNVDSPLFKPTQAGLEAFMASVLTATALDLTVSIYYTVATDTTCRYQFITVHNQ